MYSIYDIMYIIILDTHFYVPSKCADMRVCVLRSALSLSYQQIWIHLYEDDVHLLPQPYKDFRPQIIKRYLTAANITRNYCCFVSPKSDDGTEIWWLVIVCMIITVYTHIPWVEILTNKLKWRMAQRVPSKLVCSTEHRKHSPTKQKWKRYTHSVARIPFSIIDTRTHTHKNCSHTVIYSLNYNLIYSIANRFLQIDLEFSKCLITFAVLLLDVVVCKNQKPKLGRKLKRNEI